MKSGDDRYQCQMALPQFGVQRQENLRQAKVLIVGAGGLGCPTAQYLAASGVGTIALADDDIVSNSNLHRQILYGPKDVHQLKVTIACQKLQAQNPDIQIIPYPIRITSDNVMELIKSFDLIIEGTDNFETKYLLNDACVIAGKPLIYGAIYQYEGQVAIWNIPDTTGGYSANYRDAFPDAEQAQIPNCRTGGVIPPLCGIVGNMQANEAIKYLTHSEEILANKLWMIDLRSGKTNIIRLKPNAGTKINKVHTSIPGISYEQLKKEIKQHSMEVLDVRSREEHQAFNIGGKNIPLS
ncbi:MAG TPA: HesA/MoeB/ThiF family protein, partial [Chitinophagaceae bacterium]|nr:HesA/MoeB/ThiF family protein [Chitinophagaceae bacterium]